MSTLTDKKISLFILLAGLFIACLVTCNLIANKFVTVNLGFYTFVLSAGVLPYPITFLITDILSELYGKKLTNKVVFSGFAASLLVVVMLKLGGGFDAISSSPVSNEVYNTSFGNSWRVILASMVAYLAAQLIDVKLFHFWKNLTKGKHLWLRNNGSTIASQLLDTTLVVVVLFAGVESGETMFGYVRDGWFFKVLCALIDTIPIYLIVIPLRKYFKIKMNQELSLQTESDILDERELD